MRLHSMASIFVTHNSECCQQLTEAEEELARLQSLLDDAMDQMAAGFRRLMPGAGDCGGSREVADAVATGDAQDAGDVVVTTLQYQDILSQLVTHLRRRLACAGALAGGLNLPFAAVMAAARGDRGALESMCSRSKGMNAALDELRRQTLANPVRQAHTGSGEVELF